MFHGNEENMHEMSNYFLGNIKVGFRSPSTESGIGYTTHKC